jgi:DNA-binding SARP family transcriptional activator
VVSIDGVVVDRQWRLRKAKTLVKVLALAPNHRAHRDVLGEQLWPNLDQAAIANNLHQALHSARTVLGQDRVVLRDDVVILGPNDDVIVDVDEFAAAAGTAISSGGLDELRRVHEMWRGDLLPEDLYEDWAAARREHVAGLRVAVAVKLAEALVERGAASHGVAILEPLGLERPSDESVNRSLMSALVAAGRRWDGAGVYERLRLRLDEEFGLPPEQETIDLFRRLFVGGAAQPKVPNNLPLFSASFVGRQAVLRDLNSALERTRLLTLTGPGGSGKTRLAIELAYSRAATGRECDGVWLVELAGVGRGGPVESAVASALGLALRRERGAPSALADQLAGRRIMLVIDNCEHVLTNVLPLTAELLKRCADVLIVATSREPLEVPGELAWRVPSLELPPAGFNTPEVLARLESVQLFVERARGVAPSFALDETNAAPIAEICRRLDGIPARTRARGGAGCACLDLGTPRSAERRAGVPAPQQWPTSRPSADHGCDAGLESGPARRRRANGVSALGGVRGRLQPRCGGVRMQRRRSRRSARPFGRQIARRRRHDERRRGALPAVGSYPSICAGPSRRSARDAGVPGSSPRLVHA